MRKSGILALLFIGCVLFGLQAQQNEVSSFFDESLSLKLLPELELSGLIRKDLEALHPKVGGEIFYSTKLPEHLAKKSSTERDLYIYNKMRQISLMQGIEYYSRSREKMRLLFEKSYMVEKFKNKEAIPDILVDRIPARESLVCFQKDLSFGKNFYRLDYDYSAPVIKLRYSNLDSMLYKGIIKAVSAEHMVIHIMIYTDQYNLYVYGVFGASVPATFGMKEKAKGSFYERMKAIRNWLLDLL